ncbi:glycosyltransferase family 52 [Ornithobacterium rhinotracheale]
MKKIKYNNVLAVDSIYSLLLYLLYVDTEEIENTLYFFSDGVHTSIRKNFKNVKYLKFKSKKTTISPRIDGLLDYLKKYFYYRKLIFFSNYVFNIKNSNIFAHDHLFFSLGLLSNKKYTLIEDGLRNYTSEEDENRPMISLNFNKLPIKIKTIKIDSSSQVKKILSTKPISGEKPNIVIDINKLWINSSQRKKKLILAKFNICDELIELFRESKNLLLTQPFYEDGILKTEKEKIDLYKEIINIHEGNLIIKTHPRENTDYKHYFPKITIIDRPIPFELLGLCGVKFNRIYTISSTSALNISTESEIILIRSGKNLIGEDVIKKMLNKE